MSVFSNERFSSGLPEFDHGDILVVDDLLANLHLLTSLLKSRGHSVRAASTGQVALEIINAKPPEVILLDIDMPGMDGFEVCRTLKSHPRHRDIPVIFLTVQTSRQDRLRAFREGGSDYITKPFDAEEVHMRVRNQLALFRMRESLLAHIASLESNHRRARLEVEAVMHAKRSLLPAACLEMPKARACCVNLPGEEVAGDIMNFAIPGHQQLTVYGVDTGSCGPAAALSASVLSVDIGQAVREEGMDPVGVIAKMTEQMMERGEQANPAKFACCLYDAKAGEVCCACSGLVWPLLLVVPAKGAVREERLDGMRVVNIPMAPGDRLYLAGGGLEKVRDVRGELFGHERCRLLAAQDRALPLREACEHMARQFSDFAHPALPPLDFSVLVIEAAA